MKRHSTTIRTFTAAAVALAAIGAMPSVASAAPSVGSAKSATAPNAFCSELDAAKTTIAGLGGSADRNAQIAQQWGKLVAVAPAAIRADLSTIEAGYAKAATQTGAAVTATLTALTAPAQKIRAYATANCAAAGASTAGNDQGNRTVDPKAFAAFVACLTKNGVTLPAGFGQRTDNKAASGATPASNANPGIGGGFGALRNDPKFQTAMQACRALQPSGFGGGSGRGGAIRTCLAAKGIQLPQRTGGNNNGGNNNGGNNNGGAGVSRGLTSSDPKVQAAIDACRAAQPKTPNAA